MRPNLRLVSRVVALSLLAQVLAAQAPGVPRFSAYQVDFAVPDAPAFVLLAVDPSTILRPQTVRELTVALADFRATDGSFSLPRSAAIEFSPGLLLAGKLTATSYQSKKLLYATRLSLASRRDSVTGAPTRLAFGLRLTIANEADFRTDTAYPTELHVTELTDTINGVHVNARRRVGPPPALLVLTPEEEKQVERLRDEIRKRWAVRYWNADILDVALGLRAQTTDSTGHDPKFDGLAVWATYGKGVGQWGQALFGARIGTARDSLGAPYRQAVSLAARFYAGANRAKAFAEVEHDLRENASAVWLLNGGLEARIAEGLWAVFSLGVKQLGGGTSRSVASFKLNTGLLGQ